MSKMRLSESVPDSPSDLVENRQSRLLGARVRLYARNPGAVIASIVMIIMLLAVVAGPFFVTGDPNAFGTTPLASPSPAHLMGTDQYGRDILIRVLLGGRGTLFTSLVAVTIGVVLGSVLGLVAGYAGGWIDTVLMLGTDVLLALPGLVLILMVIAVLGAGPISVQVAVGIGLIPTYIRLVRATTLELKNLPFIEAARALGCSPTRVMMRHLTPNLLLPLLVLSSAAIGWAIATGAAVNFLGLGVQQPTADWGLDLAQAVNYIGVAWWVLFPGGMIVVAIIAVNLIGDGMQTTLDPKLRYRMNT